VGRTCPHCRADNPEDARFCTGCGGSVSVSCAGCGRPARATDRFCAGCGRPLISATGPAGPAAEAAEAPGPAAGLDGERKQVTVLFADLARSMELAEGQDPEDWALLMDRFFRALSDGVVAFGGTVDKFTGDGIMALFGAPASQEDHARRACAAALALQAATAELGLVVRLGLNSGEVVVGGIGAEGRLEYTALGHTVGLAQRMEALAEPGAACLTEHTARLVRAHFRLRDKGLVDVKGSSEPVRVFTLEGATRRSGTGGGSAALVGRAEELGALEAALARAREGEAQVVGIVGEAGVGKSRLCDEFARSAQARGVTVRRAAGVSHARDIPLLPVLEFMRDYFDILETDGRAAAREKIAARLLALDPSQAEDLPLLFDFLEVPDEDQPGPRLSPEVRLERIFALLRRLTQRRSERDLVILLLEDLHWFDAASLSFVERLIPSFPGTRTLVLTNFRPEFSPPWAAHSYYRQLPLSPLDPEAVGRLLTALLGRHPTLAPLAESITDATGGSPFFIEEVVRSLVEDGTLAGEPGAYHVTRSVESLQVPPTVQATLAARIDRLAATDKAVLQTAAVVGRNFTEPIVRMASAEVVAGALGRLCTAEFLQVVADGPVEVEEYRFWHPLTQEVAYRSLLRERRAAIHGAVARAIIATDPGRLDERAALLATHFGRAGEALEAARWSERAGDFAVRSDIDEAMRRWRTALAHHEETAASEESVGLGIRCRSKLIRYLLRRGDAHDEAARLYEEARAIAGHGGDPAPLAALNFAYGTALVMDGLVREGTEGWLEAARIAERSEDPRIRAAFALCRATTARWVGPVTSGLVAAAEVKAGCGGDPSFAVELFGYSPASPASVIEAELLVLAGRRDEARTVLDELVAGPRRQADAEWICWAAAVYPSVARSEAELATSVDWAQKISEGVEASGNRVYLMASIGIAIACIGLRQYVRAIELLESVLADLRRLRVLLCDESRLVAHLAEARLGLGDADAARQAAAAAVDIARRQGASVFECFALLTRARVWRATGGDRGAIDADLRAALALARRLDLVAYETEIEAESTAAGRAPRG
jgi:adenylate cyclase